MWGCSEKMKDASTATQKSNATMDGSTTSRIQTGDQSIHCVETFLLVDMIRSRKEKKRSF
ncbi:Protein of unknown function [Gryllus bimaculatus]|nr:Protein of unknown function [Gryllus bimaculatus]